MNPIKKPNADRKGWRTDVRPSDAPAVGRIVAATGFFTEAEVAIAIELVDETLEKGDASGYRFVFADDPVSGELQGYTCFGKIPATEASYDLYWIAVAPDAQRLGLGTALLNDAEARCRSAGAVQLFIETSGRDVYQSTRTFYEQLGYRTAATLDDFYAAGDSKIIYVKRLS